MIYTISTLFPAAPPFAEAVASSTWGGSWRLLRHRPSAVNKTERGPRARDSTKEGRKPIYEGEAPRGGADPPLSPPPPPSSSPIRWVIDIAAWSDIFSLFLHSRRTFPGLSWIRRRRKKNLCRFPSRELARRWRQLSEYKISEAPLPLRRYAYIKTTTEREREREGPGHAGEGGAFLATNARSPSRQKSSARPLSPGSGGPAGEEMGMGVILPSPSVWRIRQLKRGRGERGWAMRRRPGS